MTYGAARAHSARGRNGLRYRANPEGEPTLKVCGQRVFGFKCHDKGDQLVGWLEHPQGTCSVPSNYEWVEASAA